MFALKVNLDKDIWAIKTMKIIKLISIIRTMTIISSRDKKKLKLSLQQNMDLKRIRS